MQVRPRSWFAAVWLPVAVLLSVGLVVWVAFWAHGQPEWGGDPLGTFAALLGACPIPASSGKTTRHRLNRGGDRAGNAALWGIVITPMVNQPATRAYVERRTKEGLSTPEIIRCLKRYTAREVFNALSRDALT